LRNSIVADDYAMSTGIYGNKYLIPFLFEEGMGDAAMEILFNRRHTSFGTMMDDGATSVWEVLEMHHVETDRSHGISSYNHPMHAGFAYVYYAYLGGIQPAEPGFKTFVVKPITSRVLITLRLRMSVNTERSKCKLIKQIGDMHMLSKSLQIRMRFCRSKKALRLLPNRALRQFVMRMTPVA
jgi:hypothetical protein